MKDFIKNVFANIVAILLIGAVLLGIMIMIFVVSAMSGDQKPFVENNSVLTINFKGNILDSYTEKEESIFDFGQNKDLLLLDVVNAINNAKKDEKIKGISIEVDNLPAGITQVDDIRAAIEDFKKSGKFVYAYGNNMSQGSYYLASVADKLYLNPVGMVELKGLSTEVTFLKDFAAKYGIGVDVIDTENSKLQ